VFQQITKDEFDSEAKYLMGENNIQLHNDFLFAMLVKCQTGSLPPLEPACELVCVTSRDSRKSLTLPTVSILLGGISMDTVM
jgi:hypothetical protein